MKNNIIFIAIIASSLLACASKHSEASLEQNEITISEVETQPSETISSTEENIPKIEETTPEKAESVEEKSIVATSNIQTPQVVEIKQENDLPENSGKKTEENMKIKEKDIEVIEEATKEVIKEDIIEIKEIEEVKPEPVIPVFSHTKWDQLTRKHVSSTGKVNYKGFKSEKAKLDAYLAELSANPPASNWSKNKRLAYWINVYNAFTVDLIVRNYPLKSIRNLNEPWKTPFFKIGNRTLSLNDVEHEIIRKEFNEARIHFAVNCASFSCPALLNQAFTEASLNSQLNRQTRAYINNPAHNSISAKKGEISSLLDWYADDFKKDAGTVIAFINKYSNTKLDANAKITFKDYNWNLNE